MEIIEEFHSRKKYPWKQWLDGKARRATKGVDYDCDTASFRSALQKAAERSGMYVETSTQGESVTFRAVVFPPRMIM